MARSPKKETSLQHPPTVPTEGTPAPYVPDNPDGRAKYRRQLEQFALLEDDEKHNQLKETWKEVAMGAAIRAKALVSTCSAKEFHLLQRVITAGAIAMDKGYPPTEQKKDHSPALVVNMFGSLGQRAAAIAMPITPETITVQAKEVTEWPDSATKTALSLPTNTAMSPTTKPSDSLSPTPLPS